MLASKLVLNACFIGGIVAASTIQLSLSPPSNASAAIPSSFVSYSIEFAFFPDYAGNSSDPNTFSLNLLDNLGALQGTNPIIRVGGNTQDYALFNASQSEALIGYFNYARSSDYPTTITIGPSYFDSYNTWPNTQFTHGFNMASNSSVGYNTLVQTAPLACEALTGSKLAYFELGNEPDLYKTSAQGATRPSWWNETDYVDEWLNKTRLLRSVIQQACPEVFQEGKFQFMAPSFAGTSNSLDPLRTWQAGLDTDKDIGIISSHNYIGGATQPGVTLQGTLMNHTSNVISVSHHLNESRLLTSLGITLPFILGETNSLYNEGAPGLSNSFGAALWGVDFNLYCAATGIRRVHMHQGTNYRYASWQPVDTVNATKGTKAPYYGNIAVASMLGNLTSGDVSIADIELGSEQNTAYAAYVGGRLERVLLVQMTEYNYTNATGPRPDETFSLQLSGGSAGQKASVQRLMANGSDAITGITFDGYSYNYELNNGLPLLQGNVTRGEVLSVSEDGMLTVDVPYSSAAIVNLQYEGWSDW